jgi:chromate transporter
MSNRADVDAIPLTQALCFWLKLGFISFGGPAGQIAIMHRELVEERRWISEGRFVHALNYCMLLPGPEAQQLATYLGWLMHRTWGGIAAGLLFVLPSLLILILLSALYVAYGQTASMQGALYGVKPAVVVLVLTAVWRLSRATLKSPLFIIIAGLAFAAILLQVPFPAVIGAAALAGFAAQGLAPHWVGDAATAHHEASTTLNTTVSTKSISNKEYRINDDTPYSMPARVTLGRTLFITVLGIAMLAGGWLALRALKGGSPLEEMARFFAQAALVTFGGAYAVLPYVTQAAVEEHQWLTAAQMMDGLALGETTPGPLIMIVAFVGYLGAVKHAALPDPLLAGIAGACVATFFTFLPSFIFILAGAPWIEHTRTQPRLYAPLKAISAAVVGVMVSLLLYFGRHVFWPAGTPGSIVSSIEWGALGIAVVAAVLTLRYHVGVLAMIAVCAILGACYSFVAS